MCRLMLVCSMPKKLTDEEIERYKCYGRFEMCVIILREKLIRETIESGRFPDSVELTLVTDKGAYAVNSASIDNLEYRI